MIQLIILSVIVVGLAVLGIAVKMFFIKGGEFKKSCSSVDEKGNTVPCSCHDKPEQKCEFYEEHHGHEDV